MKREEKKEIIDNLVKEVEAYNHFYLADTSGLNAEMTSKLRRKCFEKEIKLIVVKNTLLKRALEQVGEGYEEIFDTMKGATSVMFCNTGNAPAKLIKDFRKGGTDKPVLKSAFVEESVYTGEESLETLVNIKSKEELIGDVIALLQSPAKNVLSALQSGGNIIHGVLETLKEKEN